jgi:glycosyltransferase involved in cell wall biosynthesis
MPPPKITIVTPSFNQARYLEETLRSVFSQRKFIHEYFVLDGGSTDGSPEIIRKYADRIDYWVSQKDRGQPDAIHQGFARATGDWLAWLNSDDLYLPGAIERIARAVEAHPDWDVITGWHARIDARSRIVSVHRMPVESARWARWGVTHVNQQTCFFRRSLYEKVGPIRQDLHCVLDTELWFRFFDAGAQWGVVNDYVAAFRMHETAKGQAWLAEYEKEFRLMDAQHPRYHGGGVKHYLGRAAHKTLQFLRGRELAARRDTARWRGKKVEDVFGAWGSDLRGFS